MQGQIKSKSISGSNIITLTSLKDVNVKNESEYNYLILDEREYIKLEYIESSGTQYILTDFFPTANTELIIKAKFKGINNLSDRTSWGIWDDNGTTMGFQFGVKDTSDLTPILYIYYADTWNQISDSHINNIPVGDYDIAIKNGNQEYNNVTFSDKTITTINYSSQAKNLGFPIIGGAYLSWSGFVKNHHIIKEIIWKDDINGSYHFIPVKRNTDNKIGLYDTVNNVFYANQGTGEFIAGPEKKGE